MTRSKGLDIEKMEAAFKRAAHKALYGTREERSGRFLLKEKLSPVHAFHRDAPKEAGATKQRRG